MRKRRFLGAADEETEMNDYIAIAICVLVWSVIIYLILSMFRINEQDE